MMKRQIQNIKWREVDWRRPFELETVFELLTHLASLTSHGALIWEVRGCGGQVRYLLGADRGRMAKLEETFRAHGHIQFFNMLKHARATIHTAKKIKISRPTLALNTDVSRSVVRAGLSAMAMAPEGEEVILQIVFGPSHSPSPLPKFLPDPHASWLQIILGNAAQASPESRSSAKEKAQRHGFSVAIRIGSSGEKNFGRVYDIFSALKILESAGVRMRAENEKAGNINRGHVPLTFPLKLSVKELGHFLLLPVGEEELPGIAGLHPKPLPPPEWYKSPTNPTHDRSFAASVNTVNRINLSISPRDSLEHAVLLGPTGCGKSTCLLNLVLSDIRGGRAVMVVDPKSDLIAEILARMPDSRKDDVVVIDASDHHPVGFNPLALKNSHNAPLIVDAILSVLKEIYSENWGVRIANVLSASLLTLIEVEGSSLLNLQPLLTDEGYRRRITAHVKDNVALKTFWADFEAMKDTERRQEVASTMNKMNQFFFRPSLRNVLGQACPRFSLDDLFSRRRIVLVPLNRGIIGAESARLLGSMIVGMTWVLALSRASIPPERRHIVNMYIDELQDFIALPNDYADALAQARGLGLSITMAHQYKDQLPLKIRAGIDANARNKIIFGLNSGDARDMAAMAPELEARDFMSLPRYQIYTSFMSNGKSTGWIKGQTLPPSPATNSAAELKARSMERYGKSAEDVEAEYLKTIRPGHSEGLSLNDGGIGRRKLS